MTIKKTTIKTAVGLIISIFAANALASATINPAPHQPVAEWLPDQPATYTKCVTEDIPFDITYEGQTGEHGHTEAIKQQGKDGIKRVCLPSQLGYEDKVTVVQQPVAHIIVRTPKPAPKPEPKPAPVTNQIANQPTARQQPAEQPTQRTQRTGAICKDGWRSHATGRGACSYHGGVREWL